MYSGYPSDHQRCIEALFTNVYANVTKSIYKRFSTDGVKKADKYLYEVEVMMEEGHIFTKVNVLEEMTTEHIHPGKHNITKLIEKCRTLFNKKTVASNKKLGRRHYNKGYPFSPKPKGATNDIFEARKEAKIRSNIFGRDINEYKELGKKVTKAYENLKIMRRNSHTLERT